MAEDVNLYGLVNKPPIDEIFNYDLVNKDPLLTEEDELAHFGILGMHWGVRRYQNPDGTLTDLGKRRLTNRLTKREKRIARRVERANKRAYKKEKRIMKKKQKILKNPSLILKYQDMFTNDEIDKAIDRINLMNKVKDLKKEKFAKGKTLCDTILSYGDVANNALKFINSDAGKAIRSKLGLGTRTLFDYGEKEKHEKELRKRQEDLEWEIKKAIEKQKRGIKDDNNNKKDDDKYDDKDKDKS